MGGLIPHSVLNGKEGVGLILASVLCRMEPAWDSVEKLLTVPLCLLHRASITSIQEHQSKKGTKGAGEEGITNDQGDQGPRGLRGPRDKGDQGDQGTRGLGNQSCVFDTDHV